MNIPSDVFLIFLGAVLTFLSTGAVEWYKNKRERDEKERNFRLLARQELRIVINILDTLKTTLEHKNYYDLNTRDRLNSSRNTLESYRKDAIHLSSEDVQEKFINVVSRISDYHAKIDSLQKLFWDAQNKLRENKPANSNKKSKNAVGASPLENEDDLNRLFNDTKLQYSIEHAELKGQIEDLIKELEN